uniref:Pectinesterase n=1 Tax=Peronospora matthiolae TaxID=2874970 RepID=A0AAV1TAJ9_9STRA
MKIFVPSLLALASVMTMIAANPIMCSGPNARIEPPVGAIVVDPTGDPRYQGSCRTMNEAVARLDLTSDKLQIIFIRPGLYKEQVVIPPLCGALVLQGATCDATSYNENQVTFTHAMSQKDVPPEVKWNRNALTSTVLFKPDNVKVYNLNIANTAGPVGQAVAAAVNGTNYGFYCCDFRGYQDTLLSNQGRQLFVKSRISGTVDFIFGTNAAAWYEQCDIDCIGKGYITANGRSTEDSDSFYVFNRANVYSSNSSLIGKTFLGRPWRLFSRVVFQNSWLGQVVNATGWAKWQENSTDNVYFGEFNNSGPGAATGARVSFSRQLTAAVDIKQLLGDNYATQWTNFPYDGLRDTVYRGRNPLLTSGSNR